MKHFCGSSAATTPVAIQQPARPERLPSASGPRNLGHLFPVNQQHQSAHQVQSQGVSLNLNVKDDAVDLEDPNPDILTIEQKAKQKQRSMCSHGKRTYQCRTCGGSGFCPHGKLKSRCRACGGASFCSHGRKRTQCKDCKGSGLCLHLRQKSQCRDCCSLKKLCQILESGIIPESNPNEPQLETDWEPLGKNLYRCMHGCTKPVPAGSRHWHMCRYHPEKHGSLNLHEALGTLRPQILQMTQNARAASFPQLVAADTQQHPVCVPEISPQIANFIGAPMLNSSLHESRLLCADNSGHQFMRSNQDAGHYLNFGFGGVPYPAMSPLELCYSSYLSALPSPFPIMQADPGPSYDAVPLRSNPWNNSFLAAGSAPLSNVSSFMPFFPNPIRQ